MTVVNFFTQSGTFFIPPYITQVIVDCRGGGGAGGSAEGTSPSNYAAAAGGGAGGAFARGIFSVTPFATISINVARTQSFSGGYGNPSYVTYLGTNTVLAVGGQGGEVVQGNDFTEVLGMGGIGTAGGSFGNLLVAGGGGAAGSTFFSGISFQPVPAGGGGGGGAGFDTPGSNASLSTGSNGGSNGAYYTSSGKGGNGGLINQAGFDAPRTPTVSSDGYGGGGGGGANLGIVGIFEGGTGGAGCITLYHNNVYEDIITRGITRTFNLSEAAGYYANLVTEVTVECWSGGGAGGGASAGFLTRGRGGGGAGGNYLKAVIPMTPENRILTITAPDNTTVGTTAGVKGGSVIIRNSLNNVVIDLPGGNGGGAGSGGTEGAGGIGSLNGIITNGVLSATAYAGGNGGTATGGSGGDSGAGGGAAGSLGNGDSANVQFQGIGRPFNPAMNISNQPYGYTHFPFFDPPDFNSSDNIAGDGGRGLQTPLDGPGGGNGNGYPGEPYGGGGGGGFSEVDNTVNGGLGSGGYVRLSFKVDSSSDFFPFFLPT